MERLIHFLSLRVKERTRRRPIVLNEVNAFLLALYHSLDLGDFAFDYSCSANSPWQKRLITQDEFFHMLQRTQFNPLKNSLLFLALMSDQCLNKDHERITRVLQLSVHFGKVTMNCF